jgi:PST family polysaccharide transporter
MNHKHSVGRTLLNALLKSITGRYALYIVQLISMMVLARMLTPEVFGVFAVIQVFAIFFTLFSEMGLGPALINEKIITKDMRDGVFSASLLIGLFLSLFFCLITPLISWFFNNPLYTLLVFPLAVGVIFNTISIVPIASLQKDKAFIVLARCEVIAELCSLLLVVFLLNYIEPIWALSFKPLSIAVIRMLLVWSASENSTVGRASFGKHLKKIMLLFKFAKPQLASNIISYSYKNYDNLLVGKYFDALSLGIYDKAYQIMRYPLMLLTFAMTPAIQPVLMELKNDRHEFERLHNRFLKYLSLLGLLVAIVVYFSSELIVAILLGKQWESVIPLLQILSLSIPIQVVISSSGGFFQAADRPDLMLKCEIFSLVVNLLSISIGVALGSLNSLCWAIFFSFSINLFQRYFVLGKSLLPNGIKGIIKQVYISLFGFVAFSVIVFYDLVI